MEDFPFEALELITENLSGLPSFCRLVIYDLLKYCNYTLGTITLNSLSEVAKKDFFISSVPGRTKEEINGDTLRNAFRTIKKAKPDQFKFTTINQRVVIEMPFIRELYAQHYQNIQEDAAVVAADVAAEETHAHIGEPGDFGGQVAGEDATDVAAASFRPIRDIKHNKTNKLTATDDLNFSKTQIEPNFQPSQATIDIAISRGLDQVTNQEEIKKFISYNQANKSLWADFNPVFLTWLEREHEYREEKRKQQKSKPTRSNNNERTRTKHNSYEALMAEVLRENSNACAPSEHYKTLRIIENELANEPSHSMALGTAHEHLWPIVHQSEWEQGQRPMARSATGFDTDCIGERHESN
jgi:hypothetical protein